MEACVHSAGRRVPGALWPVGSGRSACGPVRDARAAFEEAGRQESPEQSNTTMTPPPGALTWAAHNHSSHLMFIKLIMLFLAAGAAAPDPATVIISKVAKDLASLGLWLHFSKHHSETTVRRVAFSKDGTQHYHRVQAILQSDLQQGTAYRICNVSLREAGSPCHHQRAVL